MKFIRSLVIAALLGICACRSPEIGNLQPQLLARIGAETGLTAARHLAVDASGNIYVFDYDDYVITKYDSDGSKLFDFGGAGEESADFQHLMAIRVLGDSLLALDAGSLSIFELSGELRSRYPFIETIVGDYPRIHSDGRWAAEWIIDETAEYALTYRRVDGTELDRVVAYSLNELFPGIQAGGMFFINRTQAPTYLYDFLADGRLLWMASDQLIVFQHDGDVDQVLYQSEAGPIPYPAEEIATMLEQQSNLSPPLFMNVPQNYQIAHQLLVDESGSIWIYLKSTERTGFLRLSPEGRETGFFTASAEFDMLSARMMIANSRMYFLAAGREETTIHYFDLP